MFPAMAVTDTQTLSALQDYYAAHQVMPSYSTLAGLLKLESKNSVSILLNRLALQQMIAYAPDKRLKPGPRFFERFVFESVQAGLPEAAGDAPPEAITLDRYLIEKPSKTILVKVKGESMIDAGIQEGDLAIVEQRHLANKGDIVVAIVDDQFTLKYFDQDRHGPFLRPANPAFAPIRGEFEIFGVMVGLVRKY